MDHAEGGVHHGGHHDVHAWQAPPDAAQGEVKTDGKPHVKHNKVVDLKAQSDTIEQAGTTQSTAVHQRNMERKASGLGYATLSQNELDSLQTGDPVIYGHKGVSRNAPPLGPGGTGNPFFNPNPMVMFYTCFFKVMQNMKWLELVATKLAVQDIKTTKEAGLNQANATLEAGKAAYRSEMAQAVVSFVQAGLGLAQTAMSGMAMFKAFKSIGKQTEELEKDSNRASKASQDGQKANKAQMENLQKGLNPKRQFMNPRNEAKAKTERELAEAAHDAKHLSPEQLKIKRETQQAQQAQTFTLEKSQLNAKEQKLYEKGEREWNKYVKEGQDEGLKDGAEKEYADDKMNQEINQAEAKIKKLEYRNTKLQNEAEAASDKLKSMQSGRMKHVGEMMMNDPHYQLFQAASGGLNQGLTGLNHYFKGRGELEQAWWNAQAQKFGMYMQIDMKGLDSAMSMIQDAYQQANEITQTLTKMSDQEQSSMRWTA